MPTSAAIQNLLRNLDLVDLEIFERLEKRGWEITFQHGSFLWANADTEEERAAGTQEAAVTAAREIYEALPKPASNDDHDPATAGRLHMKEAHEVNLRDAVTAHLKAADIPFRLDVPTAKEPADIVTDECIYEMFCGLNESNLREVAMKLNDKTNEIDQAADSAIITCCAEDPEGLKETVEEYALGVRIQTLKEFKAFTGTAAIDASPDASVDASANSSPAPDAPPLTLLQEMLPSKMSTHVLLMQRTGLNFEHVKELRAVLEAGGKFKDPNEIFYDGEHYWVAEGNHRREAALPTDTPLAINLHYGSLRDAIEFALKANAEHGLILSRDDKRMKAVIMLADPIWFKESDSVLSTVARGITQQFISSVRRDLARILPDFDPESMRDQPDEVFKALGETYDVSPGLLKVLCRIPSEEFAALSQNILSDDGLRRGADGIVRSMPRKADPATEEEPLPFGVADAPEPSPDQRAAILKALEATQRERWGVLMQTGAAEDGGVKPVSESELVAYKERERVYEDAYETAIEELGGDSDAVQEVQDRVEEPDVFETQVSAERESAEASPSITPAREDIPVGEAVVTEQAPAAPVRQETRTQAPQPQASASEDPEGWSELPLVINIAVRAGKSIKRGITVSGRAGEGKPIFKTEFTDADLEPMPPALLALVESLKSAYARSGAKVATARKAAATRKPAATKAAKSKPANKRPAPKKPSSRASSSK